MKRFLAVLLALAALLPFSPANAYMVLQQNPDGTAQWVDEEGNTIIVGQFYLTVSITDVSQAQTVAVAIPITSAKVTFIQSVMAGDITTANATLRFDILDSTGTVVTRITDASTGIMTLTARTGTGAETGDIDTYTPTSGNALEKNQSISIYTDGGSTNVNAPTRATLTITIAPY